jgi:hypothetical protein
VLGPDGLSRFEDLRRREAAHNAILYAFDLIEQAKERDRIELTRLVSVAKCVDFPDDGSVMPMNWA